MAAMTVAEAVTYVRRKLDARDTADDRWDDADDIKPTLEAQLDRTLSDLLRTNQAARLAETASVAFATGVADLSAYDPQRIWSTVLVSGTERVLLDQANTDSRWRKDTTSGTLEVSLVRRLTLSGTDSDPLVQVGGTHRFAPGFERVVCLRAAAELATDDAAPRPELRAILADYEKTFFSQRGANDMHAHFAPRADCLHGHRRLSWSYDFNTQALQLWGRA